MPLNCSDLHARDLHTPSGLPRIKKSSYVKFKMAARGCTHEAERSCPSRVGIIGSPPTPGSRFKVRLIRCPVFASARTEYPPHSSPLPTATVLFPLQDFRRRTGGNSVVGDLHSWSIRRGRRHLVLVLLASGYFETGWSFCLFYEFLKRGLFVSEYLHRGFGFGDKLYNTL